MTMRRAWGLVFLAVFLCDGPSIQAQGAVRGATVSKKIVYNLPASAREACARIRVPADPDTGYAVGLMPKGNSVRLTVLSFGAEFDNFHDLGVCYDPKTRRLQTVQAAGLAAQSTVETRERREFLPHLPVGGDDLASAVTQVKLANLSTEGSNFVFYDYNLSDGTVVPLRATFFDGQFLDGIGGFSLIAPSSSRSFTLSPIPEPIPELPEVDTSLRSGWIEFRSNEFRESPDEEWQPTIRCETRFRILASGQPSEVATQVSAGATDQTFFLEKTETRDSGFAVANPHDEEVSVAVSVVLGPERLATEIVTLGPRQQQALFVSELLTGNPEWEFVINHPNVQGRISATVEVVVLGESPRPVPITIIQTSAEPFVMSNGLAFEGRGRNQSTIP